VAQDNPCEKKVRVKGIGDAGVVNNGKVGVLTKPPYHSACSHNAHCSLALSTHSGG